MRTTIHDILQLRKAVQVRRTYDEEFYAEDCHHEFDGNMMSLRTDRFSDNTKFGENIAH